MDDKWVIIFFRRIYLKSFPWNPIKRDVKSRAKIRDEMLLLKLGGQGQARYHATDLVLLTRWLPRGAPACGPSWTRSNIDPYRGLPLNAIQQFTSYFDQCCWASVLGLFIRAGLMVEWLLNTCLEIFEIVVHTSKYTYTT